MLTAAVQGVVSITATVRVITIVESRSSSSSSSNTSSNSRSPLGVERAVVFEPQGLLGLDNLEEDRKVLSFTGVRAHGGTRTSLRLGHGCSSFGKLSNMNVIMVWAWML